MRFDNLHFQFFVDASCEDVNGVYTSNSSRWEINGFYQRTASIELEKLEYQNLTAYHVVTV